MSAEESDIFVFVLLTVKVISHDSLSQCIYKLSYKLLFKVKTASLFQSISIS